MQKQNNIKHKLSQTDSIQIIRGIICDHPDSSRVQISRQVCEHFGFYNAKSQPQQSGCLKALRELEKPENFTLPKPRSATKRKISPKRLEQAVPLPVNVPSKAGEILGLQLIQVSNPEQMALWNELMIREHPRKTTQMRGQKTVLNIQDGTDLNYSSLAKCTGLGLIGSNQTTAKSRGFYLHSTFVVSTEVAVRYRTIQMHAPTTPEHKGKLPISLSMVHIREESICN